MCNFKLLFFVYDKMINVHRKRYMLIIIASSIYNRTKCNHYENRTELKNNLPCIQFKLFYKISWPILFF